MKTTTTEKRRDRQGRFIRTCLGATFNDSCQTEARYYIDGYGFFGLSGTSGQAVYCLKHARRVLTRMQNAGKRYGRSRSTYNIRESGTHRRIK